MIRAIALAFGWLLAGATMLAYWGGVVCVGLIAISFTDSGLCGLLAIALGALFWAHLERKFREPLGFEREIPGGRDEDRHGA